MFLTEKEEEKMSLTEHTEFTERKQKEQSVGFIFFRFRKKIKQTSFSVASVSSSELGERVRATPNSGIALIMVLGLLTVMVILAVTFAISMRTERLAAGNAADTVRARELVQVGLARALNDLATNLLGTNGLSGLNGKVYPTWNVTNSYTNINSFGAARWNTNIYLIQRSATNYIPRALWTDATNADLTNPSNHWLPVESLVYTNNGINDFLVESNLMGRVAYLILNCSGLLDANYAGGSARQFGINPAEIAIEKLEEIGTFYLNDFTNTRISDVRYETLADLNARGRFYSPATNLFVYSRALPACWNNGDITQVNLSGTEIDIYNRQAEITNALVNIGFSESEARVIWRNLMDYIDSGSVPTNLTTCVEAVPMINEIIFRCETEPPPPLNNKKLSVYYELWFPFVAGGGTFSFNGQVKFGATTCATVTNNFVISSAGFKVIGPFTATTTDSDPFVPTIVQAEVTYSGQTVDELAANSILNGISIVNDAPSSISLECLDPRFNKDPTDPLYWRLAAAPTPGVINSWVSGWWQTNQNGDINSEMYVANRPLQSVVELGYLVYTNAPWRTVKLFDPGMKRVLDYFAIGTNDTDVYVTHAQDARRGLVNPNSMQVDALAAVFADMPIDEYPDPGNPSPVRLCMDSARVIAQTLYANRYYTNLSDIGRAFENISQLTNTAGEVITFDNELKKESLFRNACGLLSVRQNMFTIIIEAQAASGGNIPRNPAKQRAVAIVWRDPYTGEMFVRHIKWLGD